MGMSGLLPPRGGCGPLARGAVEWAMSFGGRCGWAVLVGLVAAGADGGIARAEGGIGLPLDLERAAVLRVPPGGFVDLADAVAALVPPSLALDGIAGEAVCVEGDPPLTYALAGIAVDVAVDEVTIAPGDGRLDVALALTLSGAGGSLDVSGTCLLPLGSDSCPFSLDPTPLRVDLGLALALDPETSAVVVPEGGATVALDFLPIPNPLDPDACLLGYLLEAEELFDVPLQEVLLGPFLEEALAGLPETVAGAVEDAFASLVVDTSLDLGAESPLSLRLAPSALAVTAAEGLELTLGGSIAVEAPASCLPEDAPVDVVSAAGPPPAFSATDGAGAPYTAALMVPIDLVDQLLLAAWRSGALCLGLDDAASAGLLGLLFPPLLDFADGDDAPVRADVAVLAPPRATFPGDPLVALQLEAVALDILVVSQARTARAFGLDLPALPAQLDVDLAGGSITPVVGVDMASVAAEVAYAEPFPDDVEALAAVVPTMLDAAVGALLADDLLGSFSVPGFQGITVADLRFAAEGEGDWLAAYAGLDATAAVPLEIDLAGACGGGGCDAGCGGDAGCADEGGCGEEGCEGGCSHAAAGGAAARLGLAFLLLGWAAGRRRR